ncbi:MAG: hypothetical protein AAFZ87_02325, partial [Planctomycetota bacterium]
RSANPELYDFLQRLELLEPLLGGQTIVITQDHWLFEGLNVPTDRTDPDEAASDGSSGDSGQ